MSVAVGCGERARLLRALVCPGRAAESSQSGSEVQVRRDGGTPFGVVSSRECPVEPERVSPGLRLQSSDRLLADCTRWCWQSMADERTDTVKTADA